MSQERRDDLLARYVTWGIVAGLLLGAAIGLLTGNYGLWSGLGMLFGIVAGTIAASLRRER